MSAEAASQSLSDQERKRGIALSSFLTISFIILIFLLCLHAWLYAASVPDAEDLIGSENFTAVERILAPFGVSEIKLSVIIFLDCLNLLFLYGIWKLRRWAVYGLSASVVIAYGINFLFLLPTIFDLLGIAGLLILIFLIRSRWANFN